MSSVSKKRCSSSPTDSERRRNYFTEHHRQEKSKFLHDIEHVGKGGQILPLQARLQTGRGHNRNIRLHRGHGELHSSIRIVAMRRGDDDRGSEHDTNQGDDVQQPPRGVPGPEVHAGDTADSPARHAGVFDAFGDVEVEAALRVRHEYE